MKNQFRLPDVGEGLVDATIVAWHVALGDDVALNQDVVDVETAKAIVTLPSPFHGIVTELLAAEGDTIEVGTPLLSLERLDDGGLDAMPVDAFTTDVEASVRDVAGAPAGPASGVEPAPSVLVGYGPQAASVVRKTRKPGWRPESLFPGSTREVFLRTADDAADARRPYAAPPVRHLARRLGVDLAEVRASGDRGQITRSDVTAAAAATPGTVPQQSRRMPASSMRKATAAAMVASAFSAPHATEWVSVDVTRTMRLVRALRQDRDFDDVRVSPLLLACRAVLLAARRFPEINASWDQDTSEVVLHRDVNLGVAVASPRGLLVPNIKAAQSLNTSELALRLDQLVTAGRNGTTGVADLRGGTLTITNIGTFGVDGGTPILNPGESAIICMGRVHRQPWEHKNRVRLRDVATISMSFDHRLVDGELGSKVLARVARLLEYPDLALAE